MSETRVISIGDLNVEAGSGYLALFDQSFQQPEANITRIERDADASAVTKMTPGMLAYILQVVVDETGSPSADAVDARRRALMRALDTTAAPVTVTIENAAGTARRRCMNFVVRKPDQMVNTYGRGFAAQLEASDDVRWRSVESVSTSWTLDASATHVLTVAGDLETYPVIEIEPQSDKAVQRWEYRRRFVIEWHSTVGGLHTIDVTGGGLDTAALLSAGKVINETNIGVLFMGTAFVRRDYGGNFGSTGTTIWITANFTPTASCWLTFPASPTSTTLDVEDGLRLRPSGFLKVGEEIISYDGRTDKKIYNVVRGAYDTTADSYPAGTDLTEVYVGYILYGPNAVTPTPLPGAVDRSPTIDLDQSTNTTWRYINTKGFNLGPERPFGWGWTQWGATSGVVNYTAPSSALGGHSDLQLLPWTAMGLRPGEAEFASFSSRYAVPIGSVRVKGRRMVAASPARYPGSPKLWVLDDAYGQQATAWDAGSGAAPPPPNATFDVTYDVSNSGWDYAATSPTRLRWAFAGNNHVQADITEALVTFTALAVPTVTMGDEETDYDLDMTITNQTTGEGVSAVFPNMAPFETLVIDSEAQAVTYTGDGSNRYDVVRRDAPRTRFLRLVPGDNLLRFEEDGMGDMQVTVRYTPRWYA